MKPVARYPLPMQLFKWLMISEGGDRVTDDPLDAGGLTKYGISQRANPGVDIRNLTEEGARVIYERKYWQAPYIDQLPRGLDYAVFDYAVNSGPVRAVKALQELVGATPDGVLGDRTIALVRDACSEAGKATVINNYCNRRTRFLISLKQQKFIKGWLARVSRVQGQAISWVSK